MSNVKKWKVVTDSPVSEGKVFEVFADVVNYGDNYLQFGRDGKWVLTVPHSRVQYFIEE